MTESSPPVRSEPSTAGTDRIKTFVDAVVAIAQTLLILPLLESVSGAHESDQPAGEWLSDNLPSFVWFAMSFVLIAVFWRLHVRLFDHVERVSGALQGVLFIWLAAIVVLPITTALLGLDDAGATAKWLYIGDLIVCGLASNAAMLIVTRDPTVRGDRPQVYVRGLAASLANTALYVLALILALAVPAIGFLAMFILSLTPLLAKVLMPLARRLMPPGSAAVADDSRASPSGT